MAVSVGVFTDWNFSFVMCSLLVQGSECFKIQTVLFFFVCLVFVGGWSGGQCVSESEDFLGNRSMEEAWRLEGWFSGWNGKRFVGQGGD